MIQLPRVGDLSTLTTLINEVETARSSMSEPAAEMRLSNAMGRWNSAITPELLKVLVSRLQALQGLVPRLRALEAFAFEINLIRESAIGRQSLHHVRHIYRLVAALGAIGFEGESYETCLAREKADAEQCAARGLYCYHFESQRTSHAPKCDKCVDDAARLNAYLEAMLATFAEETAEDDDPDADRSGYLRGFRDGRTVTLKTIERAKRLASLAAPRASSDAAQHENYGDYCAGYWDALEDICDVLMIEPKFTRGKPAPTEGV